MEDAGVKRRVEVEEKVDRRAVGKGEAEKKEQEAAGEDGCRAVGAGEAGKLEPGEAVEDGRQVTRWMAQGTT